MSTSKNRKKFYKLENLAYHFFITDSKGKTHFFKTKKGALRFLKKMEKEGGC